MRLKKEEIWVFGLNLGVWQEVWVFGKKFGCLARSLGVWQEVWVFGKKFGCLAEVWVFVSNSGV